MFLQPNIMSMLIAVLLIYFLWMDLALFNVLYHFKQLPSEDNSPHYSPLRPVTIKLLLQSPTNNYVDSPLSYATLYLTNIGNYVTADAVSIFSVFVAGLSSKFVSNVGSHKARQIGVVIFKIRDYLDAVDGDVARFRRKETRVIPNPSSRGYYMDGVCDGFGVIFFMSAVGYYIYQERKRYLLKVTTTKYRFILGQVAVMLLQNLVSSLAWNYFMFKYHLLLETDTLVKDSEAQKAAFGHASFWVIIYFWRLLNPHSLCQYILVSVLYNKEDKYWTFIRWNGFVMLILLIFCSELNYQYLSYILLKV